MKPPRGGDAPSIGGAIFTLAVLVGATGMGVYMASALLVSRTMERHLVSDSAELARATMTSIGLATAEPLESLRPIADLAGAVGAQSPGLRLAIEAAIARSGLVESIRLVSSIGRVELAVPEGRVMEGADFSGSPLVRAGTAGRTLWSSIYAGIEDGRREIAVALPAGTGVLVATLDFEALAARIAELVDPRDLSITIVDAGGTYIVHPDPRAIERREVNYGFLERRIASPDEQTYEYVDRTSVPNLSVHAGLIPGTGWYVLVGRKADFASAAIRNTAIGGSIVAAAFTIAALGLAGLISRRIVEDVSKASTEAAAALVTGVRIHSTSLRYREIRSLAESLAAAIDRWKETDEARSKLEELNRRLSEAMDELGRTQKALIEREKLATLGDLAAGIAHEINSPLGAALSAARTLRTVLKSGFENLFQGEKEDHAGTYAGLATLVAKAPEHLSWIDGATRRDATKRLVGALGASPRARKLADHILDVFGDEPDDAIVSILETTPPLLGEAGLDFAECIVLAEIVQTAVERASHVIGALRNYTVDGRARQEERIDLASTVEEALKLLANRMRLGVDLRFEPEPRPIVVALADELTRVWTILVSNAGQALDWRGHIIVSIRVRDGQAVVGVEDDGPGIAEDIRDRIFEPFVTTKLRGEGAGLGLSIARSIVESHGGSIRWESRPGRTLFEVILPVATGGSPG